MFTLTKKDIEFLERNIEETWNSQKDAILYRGKDFNEWPKRSWNWVYPSFYRKP